MKNWAIILTDKERIWFRAMMHGIRHGYSVSGDDRSRAKFWEARLAPSALKATK